MESLDRRRTISNAVLMFKLTNGIIDLKELRDLIMINQTRYQTRNKQMLVIPPTTSNYMYNCPMLRFLRMFNEYSNSFLTSESIHIFKNQIRAQIV